MGDSRLGTLQSDAPADCCGCPTSPACFSWVFITVGSGVPLSLQSVVNALEMQNTAVTGHSPAGDSSLYASEPHPSSSLEDSRHGSVIEPHPSLSRGNSKWVLYHWEDSRQMF